MAPPELGFAVTYATHRALAADHSAFLTHGGLIVRVPAAEAPAPKTPLLLRIEAPDGTVFDLSAEAGQYLGNKGFMASFEADRAARATLDEHVASQAFRASVERDPEGIEVPSFRRLHGAELSRRTPPAPAAAPRPAEADVTALHPDIDTVPTLRRTSSARSGRGARTPSPAKAAPQGPPTEGTQLRRPAPGEEYAVFVVRFPTVRTFASVQPAFEKTQIFRVDWQETEAGVNQPALLRLILPGHNQFEVMGVIERIDPDFVEVRVDANDEIYRKACLYPTTIAARKRIETEPEDETSVAQVIRLKDQAPEADLEKMPIRRRLQRMGMDDKINLALAGNREERMALAMDHNRAVHHYLLKNAKITLDEIAFMARLPGLNPDVLDKIAENPMYTQNPTVTKALVYNPKTPVRTAIRLLDRLPRSEVMNLAKRTNMNLRLVMAAKKKIERSKG